MKIGILASGALGYQTVIKLLASHTIHLLATDKKSTSLIELAGRNSIPVFTGNPRNGTLSDFMNDKYIDILLSINYLFLIEHDIISQVKYAINFHGSLLPKYRGRTPHVWAIINNEKETGITAHLIDKGCDTGDIILQQHIPITSEMTGADILESYAGIYPSMINEIIELARNRNIKAEKQDHRKATYYGKRIPEDGAINWCWQKERIYNWVRAQAYPYPGAFTFHQGKKLVIDKISFSDYGYHFDDINGKILALKEDKPVVKTPNGAILIESYRDHDEYKFQINDVLNNVDR